MRRVFPFLALAYFFAASDARIAAASPASPQISIQPLSATVVEGGEAVFSVQVSSPSPVSFQWVLNAAPIVGATNFVLDLFQVTAAQAGAYSVIVSNSAGATTSSNATLTVRPEGPLDQWSWRRPQPQGNTLSAVAWRNGQFIAAGYRGTLVASTNGIDWSNIISLEAGPDFFGIAAGPSNYVAVGESQVGAAAIYTSADGVRWGQKNSGDFRAFWGVTFGGGTYVAFGWRLGGGVGVLTSPDGEVWTSYPTAGPGLPGLASVAYGNGRFVGVGSSVVQMSLDGARWTNVSKDFSFRDANFTSVAYGGGQFAVLGKITNAVVALLSTNGTSWTPHLVTPEDLTTTSIAAGDGRFIALVTDFRATAGPIIYLSTNGVEWDRATLPLPERVETTLHGATYGSGKFVAVGAHGNILTSARGDEWEYRAGGTSINFRDAAWGSGRFVAVGNDGKLLTSTDALDWGEVNVGEMVTNVNLRSVVYGTNRFVVVGQDSTVLVSSNGLDWVKVPLSPQMSLYGVAWNGERFLAVGNNGVIIASADGLTWTNRNSGVFERLQGIAFGHGLWVVTGTFGRILTSPDGITWTVRSSPLLSYWQSVVFGNGLFVAAGSQGMVISTNGIDWAANTNFSGSTEEVLFGGGLFLAAGNGGLLATSPDGLRWTYRRTFTHVSLRGGVYANGAFLVTGNNDVIIQSDLRPRLFAQNPPANSGLELLLRSESGLVHQLEVSTDLQNWSPLALVTNSQVLEKFIDQPASNHPHRFYRVSRRD